MNAVVYARDINKWAWLYLSKNGITHGSFRDDVYVAILPLGKWIFESQTYLQQLTQNFLRQS